MDKKLISLNKSKNRSVGQNISQNKTTVSINTIKNISNSKKCFELSDSDSSSNTSNNSSFYKTKVDNNTKVSKTKKLKLNLYPVLKSQGPSSNTSRFFNSNSLRDTSHTIFSRFHNEFRKTFSQNINTQLKSMTKLMYTMNPKSFPYITKKKLLLRKRSLKINPNQANKNDSFDSLKTDEENTSSSGTATIKNITYTEPSKIQYSQKISHKRLREFKKYIKEDYIIKSRWKTNEGLMRQEGKIHIILLKDKDFQSNYIKDELLILLDNIQYLKSSVFSSDDVVSAFKNKDLHYQISTNKILEETCALIDQIPKYILCEYYDYSDRFIAIDGGTFEDFVSKYITNEDQVFVVNVKLLCKLTNFLKCSFEVYLTLINQVDDVTLKPKKFEILRMILEKCRFNINEIISRSKNSIHDLNFDRELIKKYQPVLRKTVITAKDIEDAYKGKQANLGDHIKHQVQFVKNEFTQKKMRIIHALNEGKDEKEMNTNIPFSKARNLQLVNMTGFHGPMALIKSQLMTKLLKYCKKDVKEKIISLRTIDRYQKQAAKK